MRARPHDMRGALNYLITRAQATPHYGAQATPHYRAQARPHYVRGGATDPRSMSWPGTMIRSGVSLSWWAGRDFARVGES